MDRLRSLFGQPGPGKRKDGLPPKTHFSIWYLLIAILLFMYVQQYFFSSKVETIPYSQFKQKVAEGSVSKLTIGPESISGTLKGKENKPDQQFATVRVDDPGLVKELDDRKIDYSGRYDSKVLGKHPFLGPSHRRYVPHLAIRHQKNGARTRGHVFRQEQGQALRGE